MITQFFKFIETILPILVQIFNHVSDGVDDPEKEKQMAMELIRKAKDAQAKQEIEG